MNLEAVAVAGMIHLAAEMPAPVIGSWCLALDRFGAYKTYYYRRCKGNEVDILVGPDGFDANETECAIETIKRQGRGEWLATFRCQGAGVNWHEDDVIRVIDGWSLEVKIRKVRKTGDPVRYCLVTGCE